MLNRRDQQPQPQHSNSVWITPGSHQYWCALRHHQNGQSPSHHVAISTQALDDAATSISGTIAESILSLTAVNTLNIFTPLDVSLRSNERKLSITGLFFLAFTHCGEHGFRSAA
ncbi:hypothetical protein [Lentzea xinjiangensis]|uniref:hypothetical protein n=1 Tax=Lentzea xinjiangensis TaxID=402600 RepID=UPI001160A4D4|nr:hypothetical protein [Lentzea xinjiangensis]